MTHGIEIWDYVDKYQAVGKAVLGFPHLFCRVKAIKENRNTENLEYLHDSNKKEG